jgi:hypothetical protein
MSPQADDSTGLRSQEFLVTMYGGQPQLDALRIGRAHGMARPIGLGVAVLHGMGYYAAMRGAWPVTW